jgi:cytochrome b involved in lipid metabolism
MKIKNLTTITLFIFWAVVVSILVAGLVFYQNKNLSQNNLGGVNNATNNQVAGNTQVAGNALQITLSLAEVAKHNLQTDCWTIVRNKVYNVTKFASLHSGGNAAILYDCGRDGTISYDTKGKNGQHKSGDINILANYYVGDFGQTTSQQTVQQNIQKANTLPAQNRGREFEDD